VEIHLLPLSYAEYHAALAGQRHDTWPSYFRYGGFPGFLEYPQSDRACRDYLSGIYHTVVLRDIQTRNNRLDMSLFELILKFLLDNIGSLISSNRIADALTASSRKTYVSTVSEYIDLMCRAFILYRAERFDLQGKRILQSGYKYYVADHGLRNLILGFRTFDQGHMLENIVFLEFIRRGYDVKIGQNERSEIDFVVRHEQGIAYYQVCLSLADPQVLDREARALLALRDNYPKTILTLDPIGRQDHEGIVIQNIQDFLLQQPDQA
jgi:predicted AAA+ superfamily ATPase